MCTGASTVRSAAGDARGEGEGENEGPREIYTAEALGDAGPAVVLAWLFTAVGGRNSRDGRQLVLPHWACRSRLAPHAPLCDLAAMCLRPMLVCAPQGGRRNSRASALREPGRCAQPLLVIGPGHWQRLHSCLRMALARIAHPPHQGGARFSPIVVLCPRYACVGRCLLAPPFVSASTRLLLGGFCFGPKA